MSDVALVVGFLIKNDYIAVVMHKVLCIKHYPHASSFSYQSVILFVCFPLNYAQLACLKLTNYQI